MTVLGSLHKITVMASVMIGIVLVVRAVLAKKMNPKVMLLLWTLVLARLCLPVTLTSPVHVADLLPKQGTPVLSEMDGAAVSRISVTPQAQTAKPGMDYIVPENSVFGTTVASGSAVRPATSGLLEQIPIESAAVGIWMLGVLTVLLLTIGRALSFRKKLRLCAPVSDTEILQVIERHQRKVGIKRRIAVLECDYLQAPAVLGYVRPRILLPAWFTKNMDKSSMDSILLHEIYHIKKHDILKNYVWLAAKAVNWFNPLVWLAYRLFENDVELCRDQMTVHHLNEDDRLEYGRSLLDAVRFCRQGRATVSAATSLFKNSSWLKERVIRIANPRKRSKSAVVISAVLGLLMLLACFTTACQPSPENSAVVGKGGLDDIINAPAAEAGEYAAPKTIREQFAIENADVPVTVSVDAQIIVPEVMAFPVVSVVPTDFVQEEVDALIAYFVGGEQLYARQNMPTKADLAEMLIKVRAEQAQARAEGDELMVADIEELISDLERRMQTAPESIERIPTDGKLTFKEGLDFLTMEAVTYPQDGQSATISAHNRWEGTATGSLFAFDTGPVFQPRASLSGKQAPGQKLTPQQAAARVESLLDELGLKNRHVVAVEAGPALIGQGALPDEDRQGYLVTCTHVVGGVPLMGGELLRGSGETDEAGNPIYAPGFRNEKIVVYIDDSGVVGFRWLNRSEIGEVLNENVRLMPFSDIWDLFKRQTISRYTAAVAGGMGDVEDLLIMIEKIELGMVSYQRQDRPGEYMLVPAWTFYGYEYTKLNGELWELGRREQSAELIVINAVDGTVM